MLGAVVAATWTVVAVEPLAPAVAVASVGPDWNRQVWLSMALVVPVAQWPELPQPSPTRRGKPKPKQRSDQQKPAARVAPAGRKLCPAELDGAQPHVAQAGHHLAKRFDVDLVFGRHGRAGPSDHPPGLALDFMVDRKTGDRLADYVLAHRGDLAATYVIWRQQINNGSGWRPMEDRGNDTANHEDHVHVSFETEGGGGLPC